MTTTNETDNGNGTAAVVPTRSEADFAERLRAETAAVRLRRRYLKDAKALSPAQRETAAAVFSADAEFLRARKKMFDTKHKKVSRANRLVDRSCEIWREFTVPYSAAEPGVRLIRRDRIAEFEDELRRVLDELGAAVAEADDVYRSEIIPEAEQRLGELFNAEDYPDSLLGCWGFDWEYPSVEPPDYLQQLNPALYAAEQARIRARFEEAVQATEQAFIAEFNEFVARLAERLEPGPDGKQKTFHESSVTNLNAFFERFRALNIGSNADLDRLVTTAQETVAGVSAKTLRTDALTRGTVRESLSAIADQLSGLMVVRPDRRITLDESDE